MEKRTQESKNSGNYISLAKNIHNVASMPLTIHSYTICVHAVTILGNHNQLQSITGYLVIALNLSARMSRNYNP